MEVEYRLNGGMLTVPGETAGFDRSSLIEGDRTRRRLQVAQVGRLRRGIRVLRGIGHRIKLRKRSTLSERIDQIDAAQGIFQGLRSRLDGVRARTLRRKRDVHRRGSDRSQRRPGERDRRHRGVKHRALRR